MVRRLSNRGFSLIELLVVVGILAIGLAIAVPGFMDLGRRNSIKTQARELKNVLERARMDAVRNRQRLTAKIDTENNRCNVETDGGAIVSTTDFEGVELSTSPDPLQIRWDTRGMTTDISTIYLAGEEATYSVSISMAGNIRIAKQ